MAELKPIKSVSAAVASEPENLWNRDFLILMLGNFITNSSFFLVMPLLAKYVLELGGSLTMAGVVVGVFAFSALLVGPFGGALTDRTNKKRLLTGCMVLNALCILGYVFVPNLAVLVGLRMVHGAGFSIGLAVNSAWMVNFIPRGRLGEGVGYFGISTVIAIAVTPNFAISLADAFGIRASYLFAAILVFGGALLLQLTHNKGVEPTAVPSWKTIRFSDIISVKILPLVYLVGLFSMGNGLVDSFLVLMCEQRSIAHVGSYFLVNALCLLLSRPLAGKLYDKHGLAFILYPALFLLP